MTQILIDEYSEVNLPSWTYDTLRPPSLTPKNIFKDIEWHIRLYRGSDLSLFTITVFVLLRMIQRLFYNLGWQKGGKTVGKS